MSLFIILISSQVASADVRCVEVHKLFRVGVPSDIIYSFVIESGTPISSLSCLAPPMEDALVYQTNNIGSSLPSSIQDALDEQELDDNEMVCGSFTCGEQTDLIADADDILRAYSYAVYHCSNSSDCDDNAYGYLATGEDTYYGITETYDVTSTPTCQQFASTAAGSLWWVLSGCRVVVWATQQNCTTQMECLQIPYEPCSSDQGYNLNAYTDPSTLQLRTDCNMVPTCTPPVPPCELDSSGEVLNAQTVTPTP
jgi:hypothetical protein